MSNFSVYNQEGYEPVYNNDTLIEVRYGDLEALLNLATDSMDFGSGFWTEEEAEIARKIAAILGIDPVLVTPHNFVCKYKGEHQWQDIPTKNLKFWPPGVTKHCVLCRHTNLGRR